MGKKGNKTMPRSTDVKAFIVTVDNEKRKQDALVVLDRMSRITGKKPTMWGTSIIGFDQYHYKYNSGREGDFFKVGFSPRKQNLAIYIMAGFDRYEKLMAKLGKYKTGKSCLYVNKLEDIDLDVLDELILRSYQHMNETYG